MSPVPDHERYVKYFKYLGDEALNSIWVGDVKPGETYAIHQPDVAAILADDPNYREVPAPAASRIRSTSVQKED